MAPFGFTVYKLIFDNNIQFVLVEHYASPMVVHIWRLGTLSNNFNRYSNFSNVLNHEKEQNQFTPEQDRSCQPNDHR